MAAGIRNTSEINTDAIAKLSLSKEENGLISRALREPQGLNENQWKKLVNLLTRKGLASTKSCRLTAKVCNAIVQAEMQCPKEDKYFRKNLLTRLQVDFKTHTAQNYEQQEHWINFVSFLCAIFDLLRVNNMPLMALTNPVADSLCSLTMEKFASSEHAMQCLVTQLQFIGEELDRLNKTKMEELFEKLKQLFLFDDITQLSRLLLLEIIELRCGGWKLSPAAYSYYYES